MKIIIISKVVSGIRPVAIGFDGNFTVLRGRLSDILKKNLIQNLLDEKITSDVQVDKSYNSCNELINEGANLLLISPYVKSAVNTKDIDKSFLYFLTEEEFVNGDVSNIVKYIKSRNI